MDLQQTQRGGEIMQRQITSRETFHNSDEVMTYLEHILEERLRAAGADRVHLWCIDASADELSHKFCERGGSPREMSEEAIACFEKAGEHHVGVVMTAGDHRVSVKASCEGYRITISFLPPPETIETSTAASDVTDAAEEDSRNLPRRPGLSSGVPASVFHEGDQHDSVLEEPGQQSSTWTRAD
jgi:hypothetical protein